MPEAQTSQSTIEVTLPDGSRRELPAGSTVLDLARSIGPRLAKDTVAGLVDGRLVDLRTPLADGADVRIVTVKDEEAGDVRSSPRTSRRSRR